VISDGTKRCRARYLDRRSGAPAMARMTSWSPHRRGRSPVRQFRRQTFGSQLRRTASLLVASGANVKAVQRMLGHALAAMTLDVYSGLFDDDLGATRRTHGCRTRRPQDFANC